MTSASRLSLLSALTLILTLAACDTASPEASADATVASAQAKAPLCHYDADADTYALKLVTARAESAHRNHGDAAPGEAVPTMEGFTFDDSCMAVADVSCPCWAESDLDVVTADNQLSGSCVPYSDGTGIELFGINDRSFVGFSALFTSSGGGVCQAVPGGVIDISAEEVQVCVRQIQDRCDEIGGPVGS